MLESVMRLVPFIIHHHLFFTSQCMPFLDFNQANKLNTRSKLGFVVDISINFYKHPPHNETNWL